MILYSQMCNVCNACNASLCTLLRATSLLVRSLSSLLRIAAVNFLRKVSMFLGNCQLS